MNFSIQVGERQGDRGGFSKDRLWGNQSYFWTAMGFRLTPAREAWKILLSWENIGITKLERLFHETKEQFVWELKIQEVVIEDLFKWHTQMLKRKAVLWFKSAQLQTKCKIKNFSNVLQEFSPVSIILFKHTWSIGISSPPAEIQPPLVGSTAAV